MKYLIIRETNRKAKHIISKHNHSYPENKRTWSSLTLEELNAFFGILIIAGVHHSNSEHVTELWKSDALPIYKASLSRNRFQDVLRFIRFDNYHTRAERQASDKAAPIRDLWLILNHNLRRHFKPYENMTVDEQLFPYRGRTKFTQYIPSKPAKYGIKVFWLADSRTGYPLQGIIYTGQAETKTHTRHPHSGNTHHRSIRADSRTNFSYENNPNTHDQGFIQIYAEQHVKLTLECAVNINFSTSIWLKDGQIVQTILKDNINNKRVSGHRFLVDSSGNLLIDNVRLEDDGRWQCEAEDALGFVVTGKQIQLTVLDPPRKPYLLIDNRILDPGNLFIPVKENTDLTVSCVVDSGNPKPILSWELALGSLVLLDAPEVPYHALNFTETVREQRVGARSDARLERVMRTHHNATLTCLVNHIALKQPVNVSLLLDVQYTPSFAISREPGFGIPIREGMPVSLKCDVDSNPRAAPLWQKDDTNPPVQQTPDGFLNFTEIRREHSGWYKCTSRHLLGRFSSIGYFLNVRYDVDVTQEPDFDVRELSSTGRHVEVDLGGAVQLACPSGTSGCWSRLEPGSGRLEPLGSSQELKIEQVLYQEAGEYRCVSPNKESLRRLDTLRNSLTVNLTITGRPMVFPTNKSITAVYGQPLTLTIEFCANPAYNKVLWIARDKVVRPGNSEDGIIAYDITNSTTNCHQAVLFLTKVTNSDIGEYSFLVRSPNGLSEGIFMVNMTYASGYIVQSASGSNSATFYVNVVNLLLLLLIFTCCY